MENLSEDLQKERDAIYDAEWERLNPHEALCRKVKGLEERLAVMEEYITRIMNEKK